MIRKVNKPTEWVSSLAVVKKRNGKLRKHYPLPVIEDILPELSNVKVFSKADLKDGFLHIGLADESSLLTTFKTSWRRHCWKRMPFGILPAPRGGWRAVRKGSQDELSSRSITTKPSSLTDFHDARLFCRFQPRLCQNSEYFLHNKFILSKTL